MKFFPVVAAASLAFASVYAAETTAPASTESAMCDLTKLRPLLADTDLTKCSTSSGLTFPPVSAPSADLLKKVCGVPECASLLKKVAALNLGDCTLGAIKIESELIKPVMKACATAATTATNTTTTNTTTAANATTTTPSTTSPATTLPTTAQVTTAPVTVDGQVGSSGSGSMEESPETSDNSSSVSATTMPSTVPKTGSASSLSMAAAGAVVSAVVVALL